MNSAADLADWGLIIVEGEDAASFLQNQLTNSVLGLTAIPSPAIASGSDAVRLVGYCSPKGRLIASAWLGLFSNENSESRYCLFISKDIAASTAKRLAMFVLRSKVTVKDVTTSWAITGYCTSGTLDALEVDKTAILLQLPDVMTAGVAMRRVLIAQPITSDQASAGAASEDAQILWRSLEVMSAIPRIVAATQDQFVPQMVNFESVYGVDFKKGCYPGQEIVARSQYRGAIKRRLQLAHCPIDLLVNVPTGPGSEIFHADDAGQPAGMVVLSAPSIANARRMDFQIEIKTELQAGGTFHLGAPDGPILMLDQLPYPLIAI
jgi:folate-binding protein YgfZ